MDVIPLTSIITEDAKDLSDVNKQVEKWLDTVWEEKERQLEYFTKHQKYDENWTVNQVWSNRVVVMCREWKISTSLIVFAIWVPASHCLPDRCSLMYRL